MQNGNAPAKSVAALINSNFKAMKSVLPKHMTAERMARIALIEVRRNPKLGQSDPATLIGAILVSSQLGLELGPQGFAYLIPYWNKERKCFEVNFQLGYRGGMNLARRSGDVGLFTAEAVHENDDFWYRLGTGNVIHHIPALGDRGKPTHYYALARLISSGHDQFRVMSVSQVEEVRDRFSKSNAAGGFNPWRDNFEAMALKTTIIRNCKFLPTSAEVQKALSLDEMADAGLAQNLAAELPFDMEIPADFENAAAAEQMDATSEKIKADLENAGAAVASDLVEPAPEAKEALDDAGVDVPGVNTPESDDFDLMDLGQLDNYLERLQDFKGLPAVLKKTAASAIKSDNLEIKRQTARKLARNE